MGVVGALTIKARYQLFGPPTLKGDNGLQGTTTNDLAWLLRSLQESIAGKETYRQQMADMIDQQRATAENMSIAAVRYSELVQQAERRSYQSRHLGSKSLTPSVINTPLMPFEC